MALFISFLINVFVVAVFAEAFYQRTNIEVVSVSAIADLFLLPKMCGVFFSGPRVFNCVCFLYSSTMCAISQEAHTHICSL